MSELLKNYQEAEKALYDHVGFVSDWVMCPIDICDDVVWDIVNDVHVKYAETEDQFHSNGDYYKDEIYKQRFYEKHVFEGEEFTMVMCNPRVDGVKWFRFFRNDKRMK